MNKAIIVAMVIAVIVVSVVGFISLPPASSQPTTKTTALVTGPSAATTSNSNPQPQGLTALPDMVGDC